MFERFTIIAGPCVLEDDGLNLEIARALYGWSQELDLPIVFKASFDKANRARLDSPRGPGIVAGLRRLERVKATVGLPVLTDIHEAGQAAAAAEVADVLQIPAFLCRQTDLVVAAGRTGKAINIKKGQWMAPEEIVGAVEKARSGGAAEVVVTERGTTFGYGDLVVDMRTFARIRASAGTRVLFDGTHSVQRPGRDRGASGGDREHVPALVRAAVAAGCDGLFLETHPDPARAPSDAASMLPLDAVPALLREAAAIRSALAHTAGSPA